MITTETMTEEEKLILALALLQYSVNRRVTDDTYGKLVSQLKQPNGIDHVLYFLSLNTEYSGRLPRPKDYKDFI